MSDKENRQRQIPSEDDLRALRAADRYFDFLAAGHVPAEDDDLSPELTELFTAWRGDIGAVPIPPTPTVDSLLGLVGDTPHPQPAAGLSSTAGGDGAVDAAGITASGGDAAQNAAADNVVDINSRRVRKTWKQEAMRAIAGAAAFLVLAAGGLTVAIQSAGINDPLWSVNRALFTSNAQDIELATYLNQDIERARALAESGKEDEANRVLDRVQGRVDAIGAEYRRETVQKNLDSTRKVVNNPVSPSTSTATSSTTSSAETSGANSTTTAEDSPSPAASATSVGEESSESDDPTNTDPSPAEETSKVSVSPSETVNSEVEKTSLSDAVREKRSVSQKVLDRNSRNNNPS